MATRRRFARREDLGLTRAEFAVLRRLDSPRKIQAFLYDLRQNFEPDGDTCHSVRESWPRASQRSASTAVQESSST